MIESYTNFKFTNEPVPDVVVRHLIKKDMADLFIMCLTSDLRKPILIPTYNTEYVIVRGDMYGIVIPSTRLFYNTLSNYIGVVFLLTSYPIGPASFVCIGTEQNINAFRYLLQSVRHQENLEWKMHNSDTRPGAGLFGWLEYYTNKVDTLARRLQQDFMLEELKEIRKWYRTYLRSKHENQILRKQFQ